MIWVRAALVLSIMVLSIIMLGPHARAEAEAPHVGRYTTVFLDGDARDRAAGRGGSGKRVRAAIVIAHDGSRYSARYEVALAGAKVPAASAELSGVVVEGDRFSAAPIPIKSAWPLYLPNDFEGRFQGPDVLVVDGKRYTRERR